MILDRQNSRPGVDSAAWYDSTLPIASCSGSPDAARIARLSEQAYTDLLAFLPINNGYAR
jgi:hypothetical protein